MEKKQRDGKKMKETKERKKQRQRNEARDKRKDKRKEWHWHFLVAKTKGNNKKF